MKGTQAMTGIYILVGVAIFLIVAAVFINSRSEDNSYSKLVTLMNESKAATKTNADKCEDLNKKYEDTQKDLVAAKDALNNAISVVTMISADLKKVEDHAKILEVRQHTLDKKFIRQDRNVNLSINTLDKPIQVEVIRKPQAQPDLTKPSNLLNGKKPLLEKAGITQ